ncbi:MAG: pro-sigmaK processing inhibitor BofA family protein [Roseburia sp.]|nr:pro-sigmaK processing inhibitor BofA family protein [Roseburia sp.]
MDVKVSMEILAGVCGLVLVILIMRKKAQFFLQFLLRTGFGAVAILWINSLLMQQGIAVSVGLNLVTLLTSGSLGIPGVALLFAISALKIL